MKFVQRSSTFALLCWTVVFSVTVFVIAAQEDNANKEKPWVVTQEELSKRNGKTKGEEIWLSILGEVYDVTLGDEYYGDGAGYSIFAGKDASVAFITGKFNEEEADQSTDVLKVAELKALDEWKAFYVKEDKYPFVGLLEGRFYDGDGNPTEELKRFKERLSTYEPPAPRKRKKKISSGDEKEVEL